MKYEERNSKIKATIIEEISQNPAFRKFEETPDPSKDVSLLESLRKELHEEGKKDFVEVLTWEIQAHHLALKSSRETRNGKEPLGPMFEGTDHEGKPWVYPDLAKFHTGMLDYYRMRLENTSNSLLRARFADILWVKEKDYEAAQIGIEAYLQNTEQFFEKEDYLYFSHFFGRAICLALEINSVTSLERLYEKSKFFLEGLESKKEYRWVIDVLYDLLSIPSEKINIDYELIVNIAERGYLWACPEHPPTDMFIVDFLKIQETVYKKLGNSTKIKECKLKNAICYERLGIEAMEAKQFLKASHFLQICLQKYISLGSYTDKVDEIKRLFKECNEKAREHEFQTITTEVKVPKEEIEKMLNFLREKNIDEILLFIATQKGFLCAVEEARKQAEETMKDFPLQYLINGTVQDQRGNIIEILDTPDKKLKKAIYENLNFHYQFLALHYLIPIFDILIIEKQCTAQNVRAFISQFDFFDDDTLMFVENGLQKYFDADYVGSIHVLTFRIEAILRHVLNYLGVPTCSTRDGKTQEKNLEGILSEEKIRSGLGEDMVTFLEWFLIDKLGFNLRHEVAHGLMEYKNFSKILNVLLIYALLLFTRFSFKKEEQTTETKGESP
jgi:hypothetical protein